MSVPCLTCRLPTVLRYDVLARHRRGETLRDLSAYVSEQGHSVSRDALHRHLTRCVAPPDDHDITDDPQGLMVAVAASDVLGQRWPTLAGELADRLVAEGATAAARIVVSSVPELMRPAIEATDDTDAVALLEARALANACRQVLSSAPPEVTRALACRVREQGADELADSLTELAQRADSPTAPARKHRRPDSPHR